MYARVRDVAYFVRTHASSSEPLELNLVRKGAGPLDPWLLKTEDWGAAVPWDS